MSWTSLVKNETGGRAVILIAVTNKKSATGFDLHRLEPWQNSWDHAKQDDPDGFAAYDMKTRIRIGIAFEGVISEVWRIHDGSWVDILDNQGNLIIKHFQGKKPNRRYGRYGFRKEEGSLKPEHYGFPDRIT